MKKTMFVLLGPLMLLLTSPDLRAQDPMEIAEGAKLWSNNCMRCHNARSPMERNDRAWATITLHMRARSNLTKSEVSAITTYLQAMNAPESPQPTKVDDSIAGTKTLERTDNAKREVNAGESRPDRDHPEQ